ncbi:MAG: hypothetical protein MZV64_64780 [Ignavibacteriales bacterium]|nr:hypothetical protein [Ignavibacteriales bacterium]
MRIKKFFEPNQDFKGYKAISPYEIPQFKPDLILVAAYYPDEIIEFIKDEIFS